MIVSDTDTMDKAPIIDDNRWVSVIQWTDESIKPDGPREVLLKVWDDIKDESVICFGVWKFDHWWRGEDRKTPIVFPEAVTAWGEVMRGIDDAIVARLFDIMDAQAQIATLREKLADAYVAASGKVIHASDCATSCAPAETPGPCDCDTEPQNAMIDP